MLCKHIIGLFIAKHQTLTNSKNIIKGNHMCLPNKIKEQVMRTSVSISIELCIYADHKQWISFNINMISLLAKNAVFLIAYCAIYIGFL